MKPKYILFYKTDDKLEEVLKTNPFNCEKPININKSMNEIIYEYNHFDLRCYKKNIIGEIYAGCRAWGLIIDEEFKNQKDWIEIYRSILKPMVNPYSIISNIKYI